MTRPALSSIARVSAALRRSRLGRDETGAVAIEFAILALPFFAIVGAILETSVVLLSSQILDSAVNDSGRLIRTGQAQSRAFTEAGFKTEICGRLYGLFGDCSGLRVSVTPINTLASATIVSPVESECDLTCAWTIEEKFEPGNGSAIVMVQAYYKWPILLSYGAMSNQPDNTRLLATVRVFRNEPF